MILDLIRFRWSAVTGPMEERLQQPEPWNGTSTLVSFGVRFSQRTALPQLGLLNAIQNIGCLAAYPFAPYVTDGAGRRSAVILGAFIMCAATVIQTASNSVNMFIGAR